MSTETSDKNVVTEEDIKILENYLKNSAYKQSNSDFFKNGGWEIVDLEVPQAIEHLLLDYKRQKQINEEHQKINGELRERIKELEEANKIFALEGSKVRLSLYIKENYIPIQKIQDKIEELNNQEKELQNSITEEEREEYEDANISFLLCDIEIRREVLKELLQEGNK